MERQEDSLWLTRMRWRMRGAWLWPAFIMLTLAEGVALEVLPIAGDGPGGVLPGVLLAGFANLICVASVTRTGARSEFSNFGPTTVDVGAPGGDASGTPDGDILSAKPAWATQFSEDFQSGSDGWTATHSSGFDWGLAGSGLDGQSATDSAPGTTSYQNNTNSTFQHTGVNLAGQRGCRVDFWLRLNGVENALGDDGRLVDAVGMGVAAAGSLFGEEFAGSTPPGVFERVELSLPGADNQADVRPTFKFRSDSTVTGDGAYVDDYSLICRGSGYPNTIAGDSPVEGGDYTAIAGTSMAAPHVAGVAALVHAVDPGAPPSQIVQAMKNGAKPAAGMAGVTVTGGVVDAVASMDAALALPNPGAAPGRPRFMSVKVTKRGMLTVGVKGDPGTSGVLTLKANITAARVRIVGRKSFRIGSTGRAAVKAKLARPALKQLRRKRKLRLTARAVTKNAAGLSSSRTGAITLKLTRRR